MKREYRLQELLELIGRTDLLHILDAPPDTPVKAERLKGLVAGVFDGKTIRLKEKYLKNPRNPAVIGPLVHEMAHAAGLEEVGAHYLEARLTGKRTYVGSEVEIHKLYNAGIYREVKNLSLRASIIFSILPFVALHRLSEGHPLSYIPLLNLLPILRFYYTNRRKWKMAYRWGELPAVRFLLKRGIKISRRTVDEFLKGRERVMEYKGRDIVVPPEDLDIETLTELVGYRPDFKKEWLRRVVELKNKKLYASVLSRGPKIPKWFFKK